jgi:integrase
MTSAEPLLSGAPGSAPQVHATEAEYKAWIYEHIPHPAARWHRMLIYRRFIESFPDLSTWFDSPLELRLGFSGGPVWTKGRTTAHEAIGYLAYLSLVRGICLDYEYLLARQFTRLSSRAAGGDGLGVDWKMFETSVGRLVQLGYAEPNARAHLTWGLTRILLRRGDPDVEAITGVDVFELAEAVRAYGARDDFVALRTAMHPGVLVSRGAAERYIKNHLNKVHATHVLLFNIGQVAEPPTTGTVRKVSNWSDRLLPEPCPPRIRTVVERYLRLRLDAKFDRPQTVRLSRESLRRFINWLGAEHPDIENLAAVDRRIAEGYLQWLPTYISKNTGQPLAVTTVKHEVNALAAFCRDTAVWGWTDVPGKPLFTLRDTPRRPESIPRYLPAHELGAVVGAIYELEDPYQRAALLLVRWSGARRDEIRRLTIDCLDTYSDGHPRLRIPVGKGHAERMIPLHPDAADALNEVIKLTKAQNAIPRRDSSVGRVVNHVFVRRGKLLSATTLFDKPLRDICMKLGLVGADGRQTVSAHRFRHTIGTQLAEGGARIQTIMAVLGHRSANMAMIYARISDPEVRRQYEQALTNGARIAGPAAEALLHGKLDDATVHWLQTNFLKTELELGHCLRLPAEGPCECDLVLNCPKFLTTSEYAPRLRARLETEKVLIQDARQRGWEREVERHQAASRRLEQLLSEVASNGGGGTGDDGVSQSPSSRQEDNRVLSKPFE